MHDHITVGELALLLALFWLPVFLVAAIAQWLLLPGRRHRAAWLLLALILECVLAMGIWVSPLHRYFIDLRVLHDLRLPGLFQIGFYPMQAAVVAAVVTTCLAAWAGRRTLRVAR